MSTALQGVRLIVVHEQATVRTHLTRLLTAEGAAVTAITRAELAIPRANIDVVFFADPQADVRVFADTITLGRRCFSDGWLVASYSEQGAQQLTPLIQAGADDMIRVPCVGTDELRVRLSAGRRFARRTSERTHDWSSTGDQVAKRAWAAIPDLFASELSAFAGRTFEPAAASPDRAVAVEIPVTLGRDRLEVLVRIHFSEPAAQALCAAMLGLDQADRSVMDDLARETANTLAGAYKRLAEEEGADATIGLPRVALTENRTSKAAHQLCLAHGDIAVGIECLLCPIEDQVLAATALREGMVVVKEVRTAGGALLIPAGTRLTANSAARLASHLGSRASVTVALAA